MNANRCIIQPRSIISNNRYMCISIPMWDWQLIRDNFNDLWSYERNAMEWYVLRLKSHTGNKNTAIHIPTSLKVIIHVRDISILYVRRIYDWIREMWLKHSRSYNVIYVVCCIQPWNINFTWYAQSLSVFFSLELVWV